MSCSVKTLYDQSGANSCTRGAGATDCNAAQATEASRPTYMISGCTGSTKNCMACSGTQGLSSPAQQSTEVQPYTISMVGNRNAATTSFGMLFAMSDFNFQVGWANSTNTLFSYAGGVGNATAADSTPHALQYVMSNAASDLNVDGSVNTVTTGTQGITAQFFGICSPAGNSFTGQFREVGLWLSAFSSGNSSAMSTNQHTRGGF